MDQTFRVLQEALCEALCSLHAKMTLQAMVGSSDSATESRVLRFSQVFLGFQNSFLKFSQVLPGPERRQTEVVHLALMLIDDSEL